MRNGYDSFGAIALGISTMIALVTLPSDPEKGVLMLFFVLALGGSASLIAGSLNRSRATQGGRDSQLGK